MAIGTAATSAKEPQVGGEIEILRETISSLENELAGLCSRIAPALRQDSPEKCGEACAPCESLAPLAEAVRSQRWRIESLRGQVRGCLDRIEI